MNKMELARNTTMAERLASATDERRSRRIGTLVIVSTFVLFGGWAALAPIASAVLASGVVKVELERQAVQHLEGGIVREIHVREGQLVEKGQVLITLDQAQFKSDLAVGGSQIQALQATLARLKAERDGLNQIVFPDDFNREDPQTAELIASENQLFTARKGSRQGEIKVLQGRIQQAESQIDGYTKINTSKNDTLLSLQAELHDLQRLIAGNFISRHKLNQIEREISELRADIAENDANIANLRVQQRETRMLIDFRKAEFRTEDINALTETQQKLDELLKRSTSLTDRVDRASIRAPAAGQVIGLRTHSPGSVLQPGTHILDIVPAGADLIVEARISPADVDSVRVDQLADIRFTGFKATTTPVIEGRLVLLAADRQLDQMTGQPYFASHVQLTPSGREQLSKLNLRIQPGIPAEVIINTGERTLLQYLVQPITNALARTFRED